MWWELYLVYVWTNWRKKDELDGVVPKLMPNSVVIAQAIHESGYGRSKFAITRNNHFGLMYKGRVISFNSVDEGIISYFNNLNSHGVYKDLREKLQKGASLKKLPHLYLWLMLKIWNMVMTF